MAKSNTSSRQRLLRVVFYICEVSCVVSFVVLEALQKLYPHQSPRFVRTFPLLFMVSLIFLLFVCFCLRRTERLLAIVGWITVFALFWYAALNPQL